jgi:hypothetical protein
MVAGCPGGGSDSPCHIDERLKTFSRHVDELLQRKLAGVPRFELGRMPVTRRIDFRDADFVSALLSTPGIDVHAVILPLLAAAPPEANDLGRLTRMPTFSEAWCSLVATGTVAHDYQKHMRSHCITDPLVSRDMNLTLDDLPVIGASRMTQVEKKKKRGKKEKRKKTGETL